MPRNRVDGDDEPAGLAHACDLRKPPPDSAHVLDDLSGQHDIVGMAARERETVFRPGQSPEQKRPG